MAKERKFDWIEFHKKIHRAEGVDPQGATVTLEDRVVIYDFFVKAIEPQTGLLLRPTHKDAAYNATRGFVSALCAFCPELKIDAGDGITTFHPNLRKDEIRTTYRARTTKEIQNILTYLRTVRVEGEMPKETDTSFCYD